MGKHSSDSDSDKRRNKSSSKTRTKHRSSSSSSSESRSRRYKRRSRSRDKYSRRSQSGSASHRPKGRRRSRSWDRPRDKRSRSRDRHRRPRRSQSREHERPRRRSASTSSRSEHKAEVPRAEPVKVDPEEISAINEEGFAPKPFVSSNKSKKVMDNIVIDLKKQTIKVPEVEPVEPDSIFHHNLFLNEEARMEKWIKELYGYRQRALQQGLKTGEK